MVSKSKFLALGAGLAIIVVAAAAIYFRSEMRCAGFAGGGVITADLPPAPPEEGNLRLIAWNIRNFPLDERPQNPMLGFSRRTNICDLEDTLTGLDGDVFAFNEILDTRRFPPILKRALYPRRISAVFSKGGGRWGQHVGIAWDEEKLRLKGKAIDIPEVMISPNLRPGLAVHLESATPGGIDLLVVSVHFAATPFGFDTRLKQYKALASWIETWMLENDEDDIVAMGDFNTTGPEWGDVDDELDIADPIFAKIGMRRLINATGCSEYWDGPGKPDGVQIAGTLDQVWIGGLEEHDTSAELQSWLHCSRLDCEDMVSHEGQEDGTYWDISDHCPLSFEVVNQDIDP